MKTEHSLNAARITRCPVCDSPATGFKELVRAPDSILERRQCDRCGEVFYMDDEGVVS